jgi:DNA-binding MarR family transcriptional regulator
MEPRATAHFPLDQSVPYLMRQTSRLFMRLLERRIARHGITIGMWFFLRALWEEDNLTQAELSDRVGVVGATTVSAVERLEREGWIARRRSEIDKRAIHVSLTPAGRQLEAEIGHHAKDAADFGLQALGPEEVALLRTWLMKIHAVLQAEEDSPSASARMR